MPVDLVRKNLVHLRKSLTLESKLRKCGNRFGMFRRDNLKSQKMCKHVKAKNGMSRETKEWPRHLWEMAQTHLNKEFGQQQKPLSFYLTIFSFQKLSTGSTEFYWYLLSSRCSQLSQLGQASRSLLPQLSQLERLQSTRFSDCLPTSILEQGHHIILWMWSVVIPFNKRAKQSRWCDSDNRCKWVS